MKKDSVSQHEHELRRVSAFICFNNGLLYSSLMILLTERMKSPPLPPPHDFSLSGSLFSGRSNQEKLPDTNCCYFEVVTQPKRTQRY